MGQRSNRDDLPIKRPMKRSPMVGRGADESLDQDVGRDDAEPRLLVSLGPRGGGFQNSSAIGRPPSATTGIGRPCELSHWASSRIPRWRKTVAARSCGVTFLLTISLPRESVAPITCPCRRPPPAS